LQADLRLWELLLVLMSPYLEVRPLLAAEVT
jgi:hypothetical protein